MIQFELPTGSSADPWLALFAGARDAAAARGSRGKPRARLVLILADELPPPKRPQRDETGRYVLAERDYHLVVTGEGQEIRLTARRASPVARPVIRHLLAALTGPLELVMLHSSSVRVGRAPPTPSQTDREVQPPASTPPPSSNEQALVFCGPPSAGKTTIACELLAGAGGVIDEEMNFIAASAAGEPWVLDYSRPARALEALVLGPPAPRGAWVRLGGLFRLRKAERCALRDLSAAEAARGVLTVPLLADDPQAIAAHARRLATLLERMPARELSFPKDARAVQEFLRRRFVPD